MNDIIFNKNRLALAVGILLGTTAQPVIAQDTAAEEEPVVEIVEVQGIRGSLIRAMDLKRSSPGVMDAISAEEMGKFPDSNLAESLQRITGVSVSRANGEGSEITVRGFGPSFNLITLNGRQMPGTGFTRSYSLQHLSSEGVSTLEVVKTVRPELPSGGLGATVNIVTAKPLQRPGQRFSVMAKALHDTSVVEGDDVTPEVAGIYSNTFNDDKFGIAASFSHYQRDFQRQQANIQGWQANIDLPEFNEATMIDPRAVDAEGNRIGNHFFPKDMNYGIDNVENERTNGQLTLQYAPYEDLTVTLDYTMTNAVVGLESVGWGIWNEFGGNVNGYELDENGTAVYADIAGNDGSFTAFRETTEVEAKSIGVNFDWQVTDDLKFNIDYHDSSNEIDNGADDGLGSNGQIILGSDKLQTKIYDYRSGEVPHAYIRWQNGTNELMPSEIDSNFSQFIHSPGESTVEQLQIDGEWYNSYFDIPMVTVKFGLARTEQTMSGTTAWSGLRGGPGFNPAFPEIFPDSMFVRHDTSNMLDEFAGGGSNLMPNYYYTYDFDEAIARQLAFLTADVVGDDVYSTDAYFDGIDSDSSVEEVTNSVYLQTEWEFDVKDYPVQVLVGARYEETEVTSTVKQRVEQQVNWVGASEWLMLYEPGGLDNYLTQYGEHDAFLPAIDIRVDLSDDLLARVSWGKTMSRAPLGDLAGGRALTGSPKPGARSGSQGNPNLQPYKSTNLDITLEYYYDEASYAYIGWFRKDVDNFIQRAVSEITVDGLYDIYNGPRYLQAIADIEGRGEQATTTAIYNQMIANGHGNESGHIAPNSNDPLIVWTISQPSNTDAKSVDGIEVALQHMFGESGFGFGVNATFVDGDVTYDVDDLEKEQSPLTGLSDSANLQAFYEKDGLSVKFTYAWRDDYLIGVGQDQGSADAPPQFFKDYAQLDMSVNYDITENLTVFFDALNLNNETEQGYGRYQEQFLFARQYGTRYALGLRYGFN